MPGQLSLSLNVSKTKELIVDFRKRQNLHLHSSYDQWDPCGEGEQLQVPRCKHLRGHDLDCTHSNTGQESQAKTVPSATAEEIQGLTSNPENFLFRGHRKCTDSVHLSNDSNRDIVHRKSLRSLSSAHEKWGQKQSVAFIICQCIKKILSANNL